NEMGSKISVANVKSAMSKGSLAGLGNAVDDDRQQRASTILRDVAYVITAHFTLTDKASVGDSEGKHLNMFKRRARNGQCFHQPCMGVREFAAHFELVEDDGSAPVVHPDLAGERDLGWMLHDIDYVRNASPRFFRAS